MAWASQTAPWPPNSHFHLCVRECPLGWSSEYLTTHLTGTAAIQSGFASHTEEMLVPLNRNIQLNGSSALYSSPFVQILSFKFWLRLYFFREAFLVLFLDSEFLQYLQHVPPSSTCIICYLLLLFYFFIFPTAQYDARLDILKIFLNIKCSGENTQRWSLKVLYLV